MKVEFKNTIELPTAWKKPVARFARSVLGQKGLDRFVYAAAIIAAMEGDKAKLLERAMALQAEARLRPEHFNGIAAALDDAERSAGSAVADELVAEVDRSRSRQARRRRVKGA